MKIIPPRTLVAWACTTWVLTMAALIFGAEVWSSYERLAQRQRVPSRASRLMLATIPTITLDSVKPESHAHSPSISMVGAIPGANNPPFFALDGRRDSRGSEHGVRRVPAREPSSLRFTETGRGPILQAFRGGAAWNANTRPGWDSSLHPAQLRGIASKEGETRKAGVAPGHHLETLATSAAGLCGLSSRQTALYLSLIARESTWRHYDAQGRVLRSSAGALGLSQVKASTAWEMGLDAMDQWQNALAGACYLRQALDRHQGNYRAALHDYHAGPWRKRTVRATIEYANQVIEGAN